MPLGSEAASKITSAPQWHQSLQRKRASIKIRAVMSSSRVAQALIVYSPLLFGFMGVYMAFHMEDPRFPWKRELTSFEEGLERRGLLGDASVCIFSHITVLISSETSVRSIAKILYSFYLMNLWHHGPQALLHLDDTSDDELDNFLNTKQVEGNAVTILFVLALNTFGGLLLLFMSNRDSKPKKE